MVRYQLALLLLVENCNSGLGRIRKREVLQCRDNLAGSRNRMNMKTGIDCVRMIAGALTLAGVTLMMTSPAAAAPPRSQGPCDIYAKAGDPCVAAHSTTRAMYASYNGPLYQVLRQSDGKTLDIGVVQPSGSPYPDAGGYANAAAQDAF